MIIRTLSPKQIPRWRDDGQHQELLAAESPATLVWIVLDTNGYNQ